ncbi:Regulatory protein YeiL [compost metagenome]
MLRTNLNFLSFIESLLKTDESLNDKIVLKEFKKSSLILEQGQKTAKIFIIKEGITKCFFSEENGKDFIVEFLGEGEIIGDIEVIRKIDCLCSIEAITDIKVYQFNFSFFESLMKENLAFNNLLVNELAERIINTSSRASFQQLFTLEHGLAKLIEFQKKQNITISKEDMAAYLGITTRSLNRVLKTIE